MKRLTICSLLGLIFFALALCNPALAFGEEAYFDNDGNMVEKEKYSTISTDRMTIVKDQLKDGYGQTYPTTKDPIKLRKKRIEQWAKERSQYDPKSLPHKIEIQPTKTAQ